MRNVFLLFVLFILFSCNQNSSNSSSSIPNSTSNTGSPNNPNANESEAQLNAVEYIKSSNSSIATSLQIQKSDLQEWEREGLLTTEEVIEISKSI